MADEWVTTTTINSKNQYDEFGNLLSLSRLYGENNVSYKRRIQDAATNLANCSYRGLINGITRELGLSLFNAITVNPKVDSQSNFLASDPYIKFDGIYLLLYSDYSQDLLDWAIDRYEPGGNYELIHKLVNKINETSFFEASINYGIDEYTKSMCILNQSNRETVRIEILPQSTKFKLNNNYLVRGTVFFSNKQTFKTEVLSENLVNSAGKYYINYTTGTITVYKIPNPLEHVRYNYSKYPFNTIASSIILHDINNDYFKTKLFEQVLQDDGTYENGRLTEIGVDTINELISVYPLYFGI